MKIGEVLAKLESLPYVTVPGECTLEDIALKVMGQRQVRGIYIVDDQGHLEGTLSLGVLIRHLTTARHKPLFHVRTLLARITSAKVADVMDRHVMFAREDEEVEQVVDRMVHSNIKEIPVLDGEQRLIAVLGLLDLWKLPEK